MRVKDINGEGKGVNGEKKGRYDEGEDVVVERINDHNLDGNEVNGR